MVQPRGAATRFTRLRTALGYDPRRGGYTATCRQCASAASVLVLRTGPRRVRYWCQRCGAVVSTSDRAVLRPIDGPAPDHGPAPDEHRAPGRGPASDGGLAAVMPSAMIAWLAGVSRRPVTLDHLDKGLMYQLYKQWDAHRAAAGGPALPAFSAVVGALHRVAYRPDLAVLALRPNCPEAATERAGHALRWLALRGAAACWINGPPVIPDPDPVAVKRAAKALRTGVVPGPEDGRAARAALFGVDGGPPLPALFPAYEPARMADALDRYLATAERPLRADVLRRLGAAA
jgi:hypothetical protein